MTDNMPGHDGRRAQHRAGRDSRRDQCLAGLAGPYLPPAAQPGVRINTEPEAGPDKVAFQIGSERYRLEPGTSEYVLLARLTGGQEARPVFLFCGQRAITNQAATRYVARHYDKLLRKHGNKSFALLLKVVNSQAYGPDVVEVVGDVTRAAQASVTTAPPSHRATD